MRIGDIYRAGKLGISMEIFPPKSADLDAALFENLGRLARYQPAFISCTYGAGGSTRHRTVELCVEIQKQFQLPTTSHFTCLGGSVQELREWLAFARGAGISNIMALRGDAPAGSTEFKQVAGGFRYANELVELIHSEFPEFGVGVAGYPEKHNEAPSLEVDLQNLVRKVQAGAHAVYTQLFFENSSFFRFRELCEQAGIRVPIIPGIMPVTNFAQIKRITQLCGAVLPESLSKKLEGASDDKEAQFEIGVDFAIQQCRELADAGVPGIHFYVLNRSQACEMILGALDFTPAAI